MAPFWFDWFILGLFLWPSSVWLLLLVFLFCSVFHKTPLVLNASFQGFLIHLLVPSSSCGFVLVSIS